MWALLITLSEMRDRYVTHTLSPGNVDGPRVSSNVLELPTSI